MATKVPKCWDVMELDPVTEIQGFNVVRRLDRKLREYKLNQVAFFRVLIMMVECVVPNCMGHRKYGVVVDENIPVVFLRHVPDQPPVYGVYKNQICKPLRVPENGDHMLVGIKWKATHMSMVIDTAKVVASIFDCLIADLRMRMLLREFCLECLFAHSNGKGLLLERFLKTILYHIVPWGRIKDRGQFVPIRSYDAQMSMKFRRLWWGSKAFKVFADYSSLKEHCMMGSPEKPIIMSKSLFEGHFVEPQTGILRNLDSITRLNILVRCNCYGAKTRISQAYCGILRKLRTMPGKNSEYIINLARWATEGDEYEDPLWNYSMFGNDVPTDRFKSDLTIPISKHCDVCNAYLHIVDVQIPKTTWLFMADLAEPLRKMSVKGLQGIGHYQVGGINFYPAFVLVYNTKNGHFSTVNLVKKDEWRFFDDTSGGLLKSCDPDKVKYQERQNLRVFFYRKTEINPHACLSRVA